MRDAGCGVREEEQKVVWGRKGKKDHRVECRVEVEVSS